MTDNLSLSALLKSDLDRYFEIHDTGHRKARRRDFWRCFLIPRCAPVGWYRLAHAAQKRGWSGLAKLLTWLNFYLYGIEISPRTVIGPAFFMPHAAGTVIGADRIGHHATIYHQVTIGAKTIDIEHRERPTIGDHVFIGSGAKVLGTISLGDHVVVGANSVVNKSAGSHVQLFGIPAKPTALPAPQDRG